MQMIPFPIEDYLHRAVRLKINKFTYESLHLSGYMNESVEFSFISPMKSRTVCSELLIIMDMIYSLPTVRLKKSSILLMKY
jgi:hypothetical protein